MKPQSRDEAILMLADYLSLNEGDILLAQGISLLSDGEKHHVQLLIDERIARLAPSLQPYYREVSFTDQKRFNAYIEQVQIRQRGGPPEEA